MTAARIEQNWRDAVDACAAARAASHATHSDARTSEEAQERHLEAMDHLIEAAPAPNLQALAYKVSLGLERAQGFDCGLLADHALAIIADIQRLAAVGAPA